ncbi:MAG: twin-arginine translocation signal domain-containing protein, partial [Planctomycetota bacterium]|nr:twin-arginine translocation signal domain-containing protein [Planctomycetota bacterium]
MPQNPPTAASTTTRREFLKTSAVAAASTILAPAFVGATDKAGTKPVVIGAGEHKYECHHGWGTLPEGIVWGETHGVAIDEAGFVYIKHRNHSAVPMDAVVVFDPAGKAVRSFGKEYHRGGHGIDIRKERNEEFLYLCDVYNRQIIKATLGGEQIWKMCYPFEARKYQKVGQFNPTNVAFAPDGVFYVADGYGSHYIHQFDRDAKWVRTWGGLGKEPGQMQTPHGIWYDNRPGREANLVVADRANNRLQYFSLDGQHKGFVIDTKPEHTFPAHFDIRGTELMVPDLFARVTIYDINNKPIVHLGYDPEWTERVKANMFALRGDPKSWEDGKFIHPHDACFDRDGNIFVVEWVPTGRV